MQVQLIITTIQQHPAKKQSSAAFFHFNDTHLLFKQKMLDGVIIIELGLISRSLYDQGDALIESNT